MIFQPSGGAGGGGGLTVYRGSEYGTNIVFETPVKLVFITWMGNVNSLPYYTILTPGDYTEIFVWTSGDDFPNEVGYNAELSADGGTLRLPNSNKPFTYYAIG